MKLIRHGEFGREKPGVFIDEKRYDCSEAFEDWNEAFFAEGGLGKLKAYLESKPDLKEVEAEARWGAPIARPWKVLCIGLNYSDHAAEAGMEIPKEPIVFMKGSNCVVGPYDELTIPRGSEKTDWEVELGIVIGKTARYLQSEEEALECIAGYCVSHDVSERAYQLERGGQWVKGKSCDGFNPLGPWLATRDEVEDVGSLAMELDVNGRRMQSGTTSKMVFSVVEIVHYLSQFMTLEPGDLINTGTPPGVGMGMKPPRFLAEGDEVRLSIEGLGSQKQKCVRAGVWTCRME